MLDVCVETLVLSARVMLLFLSQVWMRAGGVSLEMAEWPMSQLEARLSPDERHWSGGGTQVRALPPRVASRRVPNRF